MNKKLIIQCAAVIFLVAGLVLIFPYTNWKESASIYGFISVALGTTGSIISLFIPSVFIFEFGSSTWIKDSDDEYYFKISSKKHGMGRSPQIQTFQLENDGYREVGVDQSFDEKGNITIAAWDKFKGRIIVK